MESAAQVLPNSQQPTSTPEIATTPAQEVLESKAPVPERLAPKFEALIKRERSAVDKEKSVKSLEAQIREREAQLAERERKIQEFESIKETNPLKALELLGMSYQDLTNIQLNQGQITPEVEIKKVESKLDKFLMEQKQEQDRQAQEKTRQEQEQEQKMVLEFKGEISNYIQDHSDRYEFISFEEAQGLVYDVIDTHYERTKNPETGEGEVMTLAQAADKVEAWLEQKYTKAPTLKKMQALLEKKVVPVPTPDLSKPQSTERQKPATLTNQHTATPTPTPPKGGILSDDERVRRAVAYALSLRK